MKEGNRFPQVQFQSNFARKLSWTNILCFKCCFSIWAHFLFFLSGRHWILEESGPAKGFFLIEHIIQCFKICYHKMQCWLLAWLVSENSWTSTWKSGRLMAICFDGSIIALRPSAERLMAFLEQLFDHCEETAELGGAKVLSDRTLLIFLYRCLAIRRLDFASSQFLAKHSLINDC